jgi:hypothetical protein
LTAIDDLGITAMKSAGKVDNLSLGEDVAALGVILLSVLASTRDTRVG